MLGRDNILANICPGIHGMFVVKLALALSLIGGVPYYEPKHGLRVRGESHLLLVGEPGTGKSQFLRYPLSGVGLHRVEREGESGCGCVYV